MKNLLSRGGAASTQATICSALESKGHIVSQPQISRLLKKINAVKTQNSQGEMVYHLPHDVIPPTMNVNLSGLILAISANEMMIIVKTSPGSAGLIARIIDNNNFDILGTIAGDDTIFVAPKSVEKMKETLASLYAFLEFKS
ncbi:ArgR family transcriptional regulator [Legionella yabuuchiae]|uniref:ArgR family transcriptional regulator n=1 Tax=Legionella yabuuchiae TaxID=376727 RepID=UPI001F5FCA3A|nr:ArgR family transcriptional regulator [Legionella yabuuchiae]